MSASIPKATGLDSNAIYYEVSPTIICVMRLYNVICLLMVVIAFIICLVKGHENSTYYLLACNLVYGDGAALKDGIDQLLPEIKKEDRHSVGSCSSAHISDDDWKRTSDVLDLEKMATYMSERKKEFITRIISEAEMKKYTRLSEARFEEIRQTDKSLERAYELYFTPGLENFPELQRKTEAMIDRLEAQPHFYCPWEREESDEVHVSRWLNKYTSNPEPEMFGFTFGDQFEPRKIVVSAEPRLSTSDTNIVLGKRKRSRDEENEQYGHCVAKCSSETRLICDSWYRPKKFRSEMP